MAAGTQPRADQTTDAEVEDRPDIGVCESTPGKSVFLEADNTDGWIASDTIVEVHR